MARYRTRVANDCGHFPEGDLFPYLFPALGLLALARSGRLHPAAAHAAARSLIDVGRETVIERVGAISELRPGVNESVYLGWLAIAFGCYRAVTGDHRDDIERRHLCHVLHAEFEARGGFPVDSFPGVVFPFDSIPPLVALTLSDRLEGENRYRAAVLRHLQWIDTAGSDPATGLPWSRVGLHGTTAPEVPRGCDLSLRIGLLRMLDPSAAERLYRRYVASHWQEMGVMAGFREWPRGHSGPTDVDSGPLVAGFGMAASGFGIGAAAVMGDHARSGRLCAQFKVVQPLVWMATRAIRLAPAHPALSQVSGLIDPRALTGFLFGDACLFLTLTWPLEWQDEWCAPAHTTGMEEH